MKKRFKALIESVCWAAGLACVGIASKIADWEERQCQRRLAKQKQHADQQSITEQKEW